MAGLAPRGSTSAGNADALDSQATDAALWPLVDEIIDDLAMEVIFSSHMEAKMGVLFLHEELLADEHVATGGRLGSHIAGGIAGLVGGERSGSDSEPPMFEKCMGMGRVSSRVASRRIAIQHRYSDDSDSDDQHHHPPPMKQRRSMKRVSTAPGNVVNQPSGRSAVPPPPPFVPVVPPHSQDDDWDGLSTPSPSSASTGSSSGNSGGGGGGGVGNACLAKTALYHHSSRR
uniref:Uncharacterized protein n=1 Tax=Macrostomum lignano TaxID=282301 RepID=A0A1I8GNH6_9PLAT